ncbi:MAG: TraR/DksA C4-type zinc finger protein [Rhodothermales bacterium]
MAEKKSDNVDSGPVSVPADASSTADAPGDGVKKKNTWFSDDDFERFETILLDRRKEAVEDIERMRAQLEDAREQAENDTAYSFHMADAGTDAMEREKLYLMIARQQKYVGYLDRALQRIEDRTYGICKVTGKPISKERLEAVPHTEISIEAKLKQKK